MKVALSILVLVMGMVSGCASDASVPLFRKVRVIEGEGKLSEVLGDHELTAFQGLLRLRLGAEMGKGVGEVLALEVDVPEGEGTEGNYLALVRNGGEGGGWELQYFEQSEHMPRADRAFHRSLTAGEAGELEGFLREHSLGEMWRGRVKSNGVASDEGAGGVLIRRGTVRQGDHEPPEGGTTKDGPPEGGAPNEEAVATQSDEDPPKGGTTNDEPLVAGARVVFRITEGRGEEGRMVVVDSPKKGDHPVVDLLGMLKRFRDDGGLAASYFQRMPVTAKSMYADPYRKVLAVWESGGDLRILVSAPLRPMEEATAGAVEDWLAYKEGRWVMSDPPPPPPEDAAATQAATAPATNPAAIATGAVVPMDVAAAQRASATQTDGGLPKGGTTSTKPGDPLAGIAWEQMRRPDPATWPSATTLVEKAREALAAGRFMDKETWWTERERNATMVYHYVPLGEKAGMRFGFVVPAFEFGDGDFVVDGEKGVMYLIHDGELFSLPVPESAMGKEAVRRAKAEMEE